MARKAVDEDLIRTCSDDRSFDRGSTYFDLGRVTHLSFTDLAATATVDGSSPYQVRLDLTHEKILGSCSCPRGDFCKHCVAVALAWKVTTDPLLLPEPPTRIDDEQLRTYLAAQDRQWLTAELLRAAEGDSLLRARLEVAAGAAQEDVLEIARLRHKLTACTWLPDDHAEEPQEWLEEIQTVLEELRRMAKAGFTIPVIELTEFTIDRLAEHDDDRFGVWDALRLAQQVHESACADGHPDPEALADRLVEQTLTAGLFSKALPGYARALSVTGLDRYRELVQDAWHNTDHEQDRNRRASIRSMLEQLAEHQGGVDQLIELLTSIEQMISEKPSKHQIHRVAELLAAQGRTEEALKWIERGLADTDPEHTGLSGARSSKVDLRMLGARMLLKAGNHREAARFLWPAFLASPSPMTFRLLAETAGDHWPQWRETALIRLNEHLATSDAMVHGRFDRLVTILLSDQDTERAWQVVRGGGVSLPCRLKAARACKTSHPAEAYPVLIDAAQSAIAENKKRNLYAQAALLLAEAQFLAKSCGHEQIFERLMAELRVEHKRKHKLLAELDKVRLP